MVSLAEILAVQRSYPQIYLACHVDHVRRKSTPFGITSAESSLLAHLDKREPRTARQLATHTGVAGSTLSASLQRLARLKYIERQPAINDRRVALVRLTEKGEAALSATSVLETERVRSVLQALTKQSRAQALRGLELLADASCRVQQKGGLRRKEN